MAGTGTRDIKRKIKSVNSTMQITKAMELVSTAKLKRTRDKMDVTKPYFETVIKAISDIMSNEKRIRHDFTARDEVKKKLYIVITADRGLCGGYNANAIKAVINDFEDKDKAAFITIGRRSSEFFKREECEVVKDYIGISEKPEYAHAQDIAKTALKLFKSEEVDEIVLVYTRFVSTIAQEATLLKLLPVEPKESVEEIDDDGMKDFVNYEPSPEEVLGYIIPKYVESTIFGGLTESAVSEQASRRMAMESATDNAVDMISELTLTYNQARQSAITQEISEIVSGAEALK